MKKLFTTLAVAAMFVGASMEAQAAYDGWWVNLGGDFNNWLWEGAQVSADGTASFSNKAIGTSEFEIKLWDGSSDSYYGTSTPVVLGTAATLSNGGGHMTISGATAGQAFDLTYNVATNTLTVTSVGGGNTGDNGNNPGGNTGENGNYPTMYMLGSAFGWSPSSSNQLSTTDGVTYTKSGVNFSAGDTFKFNGGDWNTRVLTYEGEVYENTNYTLYFKEGENTDCKAGGNYSNATVKLVCNSDFTSATLTIVTNGSTPTPDIDPTPGPTPGNGPEHVYLVGNVNGMEWDPCNAPEMTRNGNVYTLSNVEISGALGSETGYFSMLTGRGTDPSNGWDGDDANPGANSFDRYGAPESDYSISMDTPAPVVLYAAGVNASSANSYAVAPGTYTITFNYSNMTVTVSGNSTPNPNPDPDPNPTPNPDPQPVDPSAPAHVYLVGNVNGMEWDPCNAPEMTRNGNVYSLDATIDGALGSETGYFSMLTGLGTDSSNGWDGDDFNPGANSFDRYGAPESDYSISLNSPAPVVLYAAGVNASSASSYAIAPGSYTFKFDYSAMTMTVLDQAGVVVLSTENAENAVYYNLQGVRVENPENGIFIRVANGKSMKVAK